MLLVGEYIPAAKDHSAIIRRAPYGEGMVFKDEDAFLNHPDKPCYKAELGDEVYIRKDFLDIFNGQEEFAKVCFDTLNWQHPETWYDEAMLNEEIGMCPRCKKLYWMYGETCACPKCGALPQE